MQSSLFEYGERDVFTIHVHKVERKAGTSVAQKELTEPKGKEVKKGTRYRIHSGYLRVLLGFNREIEFMTKDKIKSQNCLFRATYLQMILDLFAMELNRVPAANPWRFRSQVLNPILQRQLRGILDEEQGAVKAEVGLTVTDAAHFYLRKDPLDPHHVSNLLRQLLYVWPVRLSLGFIGRECSDMAWTVGLRNTENLVNERRQVLDEVWESEMLSQNEKNLITLERLDVYYAAILATAVSTNSFGIIGGAHRLNLEWTESWMIPRMGVTGPTTVGGGFMSGFFRLLAGGLIFFTIRVCSPGVGERASIHSLLDPQAGFFSPRHLLAR